MKKQTNKKDRRCLLKVALWASIVIFMIVEIVAVKVAGIDFETSGERNHIFGPPLPLACVVGKEGEIDDDWITRCGKREEERRGENRLCRVNVAS
jgi:hypothetical protein